MNLVLNIDPDIAESIKTAAKARGFMLKGEFLGILVGSISPDNKMDSLETIPGVLHVKEDIA